MSWKTKLEKTPKIGDKLMLPTLTGMAPFTVTQLDGDRGTVECGDCIGQIKKEDGEWVHPHGLIDRHVLARGVIANVVDKLPSSPMNPHIGTSKTYK